MMGKLTKKKARKILHDGSVHGKKLTPKQRRYMGAVSSGYARYGSYMPIYQVGGMLMPLDNLTQIPATVPLNVMPGSDTNTIVSNFMDNRYPINRTIPVITPGKFTNIPDSDRYSVMHTSKSLSADKLYEKRYGGYFQEGGDIMPPVESGGLSGILGGGVGAQIPGMLDTALEMANTSGPKGAMTGSLVGSGVDAAASFIPGVGPLISQMGIGKKLGTFIGGKLEKDQFKPNPTTPSGNTAGNFRDYQRGGQVSQGGYDDTYPDTVSMRDYNKFLSIADTVKKNGNSFVGVPVKDRDFYRKIYDTTSKRNVLPVASVVANRITSKEPSFFSNPREVTKNYIKENMSGTGLGAIFNSMLKSPEEILQRGGQLDAAYSSLSPYAGNIPQRAPHFKFYTNGNISYPTLQRTPEIPSVVSPNDIRSSKQYQNGGYAYDRALELGYTPDSTGHWPSRDYVTGQYLKSPDHPTTFMSVMTDELMGGKVRKDINGNFYSIDKNQQYPNFDLNNPPKLDFKQSGGYSPSMSSPGGGSLNFRNVEANAEIEGDEYVFEPEGIDEQTFKMLDNTGTEHKSKFGFKVKGSDHDEGGVKVASQKGYIASKYLGVDGKKASKANPSVAKTMLERGGKVLAKGQERSWDKFGVNQWNPGAVKHHLKMMEETRDTAEGNKIMKEMETMLKDKSISREEKKLKLNQLLGQIGIQPQTTIPTDMMGSPGMM